MPFSSSISVSLGYFFYPFKMLKWNSFVVDQIGMAIELFWQCNMVHNACVHIDIHLFAWTILNQIDDGSIWYDAVVVKTIKAIEMSTSWWKIVVAFDIINDGMYGVYTVCTPLQSRNYRIQKEYFEYSAHFFFGLSMINWSMWYFY